MSSTRPSSPALSASRRSSLVASNFGVRPQSPNASSAAPRTLPPSSAAMRSPTPPPHDSRAPLLPSFASGRRLPPPNSSADFPSYGTDPRAYTYSMTTSSNGGAYAGGYDGERGRAGGTRPSLPSGWGGKAPSAFSPEMPPPSVPRRPPSPARSSMLPPPPPSRTSTPLAPSSSSSSSSYGGPSTQSTPAYRLVTSTTPRRPPSPPLVAAGAGRPPVSALSTTGLNGSGRTRRLSQVEPDAPSQPPSPSAPAYGRASGHHHSTRLNEPGYRSLVRRSSFSSDSPSTFSSSTVPPPPPSSRPSLSSYPSHVSLRPPSPGASFLSHRPSLTSLRSPPSSYGNFTRPPSTFGSSRPVDGSGLGSQNRSSSPAKRTNFSATEVKAMSQLWDAGVYYPGSAEVESLIRSTGLTKIQIRNWFANRRQRATGEEKAAVQRRGRELALV